MLRVCFFLLSFVLVFCANSCTTKKQTTTDRYPKEILPPISKEVKTAKNIIFLIGDGMGIGQISAGTYFNNNASSLERFKTVGLHKPHAENNLITDSAAAATAFATGVKTYNQAIAVGMDSLPRQTILEEAEMKGLKTGLVATSTIVHATPASFIAHNKYRKNYESIASDFLKTDIDFFVGGGKKYFDRREKDERNLIKEMEAKGYTIVSYLDEMSERKIKLETADKFGYLTADKDPLPVMQDRDYLIPSSMEGINFLNNKAQDQGFFIMIESSQIDWGGHANNEAWIIGEFLEFSRLIDKVMDWAEEDGETLVVVTADHETGGFTLQEGSQMDSLVTTFTSDKHTGDFIPVFAYGPGSERFGGIYENTEIYHKMRAAMGWKEIKTSSSNSR